MNSMTGLKSDYVPSSLYEITETNKGDITICLKGRMDIETYTPFLSEVQKAIKATPPVSLTIDLEKVSYFDDFGALVLFEIKQLVAPKGKFSIVNINTKIKEMLDSVNLVSQKELADPKSKKPFNIFVRVGDSIIKELSNIRFMISFVGSVSLSLIRICFNPRLLRINDVIKNMEKTGVDALPIIALSSFLLGLIMAFLSSIQLQQFGANIYVASLVALSMVSELGPIITAIIIAGRSGSAYAAEIGTMKISEEIDALFTMGFDPTLFLAVPRIIALVIVVPLLTLFANTFAIAGGTVVGIFMLDLTLSSYIKQTINTLTLFEVGWGLFKSSIFAVLIAGIACLKGFQTRGGAASVGNATTSAVVSSIFLIILCDSIFAIIRSYW